MSAVIKANGYGLGAVQVAGALIKEGCKDFFIANIDEALELRDHYQDINLYILNGFYESHASDYKIHGLIPVIGSFKELEYIKSQMPELPIFLHFNTRMNRLGFGAVEQEELWKNMDRLDGLNIKGVMSHLACSDEKNHPMNALQQELFSNIATHFPNATKALSNSSGIFRGDHFHFDMVRPGACLYGVNPTPEEPNPMEQVIELKIPIVRTRKVYKDAVVGYNATYRFKKDSEIATVSAGYADGLLRSLSNSGALYWNGIRCPIRGRVSMDLTTVDLSDILEGKRPKPGDYLEAIGPSQTVDDIAHDAETIGYEILTSLRNRYKRTYKD